MKSFSYLEPVCCSMSSSNCCFLTCIQISQEADQVVWYSHLFQNFPVYCDPTVKGFGIVNKAEIDVFLELSCFFHDDTAIPLLGIHTEETRTERDMCTPMFIASLIIVARTWKQPRCPSADEWIRKLWYIYTMEYYSVIKKNTFESVLMRWMKLQPIIQSEVSQKEKHQYSMLMHIYGI